MTVTTRPASDADASSPVPTPAGPRPDAAGVSKPRAALAGAAAAGAALAAGELTTSIEGPGPTLVTAVGSEFIDRYAASLKDLAVQIFGTNDKPALVVGIVVTSIVLGALIGLAARRRWFVAPVGFGVFGLVGALALSGDPQGSTSTAVVGAIVSVIAGIASFACLWILARRPAAGPARAVPPAADGVGGPPADGPSADGRTRRTLLDRRGFVLGAGAIVLASGGATVIGRRLRNAEAVDAARRTTVLPRAGSSTLPPAAQPFEVPGLTPYIVPNADFYRIDTALSTPQVGLDGWRLSVTGLVDEPFELTFDQLLEFDSVEETVTIQCVSNEVGGGLIGNAVWQGVPLATVLERAGVQSEATQIVGRSVDGFTAGFPTEAAFDGRTALVAYGMNGEPLPADHGFPARLIVAGLYGYVSATKWLEEIELTTWEDFDGYWVPRGWSKEGPVKTASRIDVPRSGATLTAGPQPIAGVAWAPHRGIERVAVQIDAGPWQECELGAVASDDTWVQWRLAWEATPGEHDVRVRATDGTGETQTEERARPAPNGSTGWHRRSFRVT